MTNYTPYNAVLADQVQSLSIIVAVPPRELRKNRGDTVWQQRAEAARQMRQNAALLWRDAVNRQHPGGNDVDSSGLVLPWPRVTLEVTQHFRGRPLDFDGLLSGVGPAIDGAMDAGILMDDRPYKHVIWALITAVPCGRSENSHVVLTITRFDRTSNRRPSLIFPAQLFTTANRETGHE